MKKILVLVFLLFIVHAECAFLDFVHNCFRSRPLIKNTLETKSSQITPPSKRSPERTEPPVLHQFLAEPYSRASSRVLELHKRLSLGYRMSFYDYLATASRDLSPLKRTEYFNPAVFFSKFSQFIGGSASKVHLEASKLFKQTKVYRECFRFNSLMRLELGDLVYNFESKLELLLKLFAEKKFFQSHVMIAYGRQPSVLETNIFINLPTGHLNLATAAKQIMSESDYKLFIHSMERFEVEWKSFDGLYASFGSQLAADLFFSIEKAFVALLETFRTEIATKIESNGVVLHMQYSVNSSPLVDAQALRQLMPHYDIYSPYYVYLNEYLGLGFNSPPMPIESSLEKSCLLWNISARAPFYNGTSNLFTSCFINDFAMTDESPDAIWPSQNVQKKLFEFFCADWNQNRELYLLSRSSIWNILQSNGSSGLAYFTLNGDGSLVQKEKLARAVLKNWLFSESDIRYEIINYLYALLPNSGPFLVPNSLKYISKAFNSKTDAWLSPMLVEYLQKLYLKVCQPPLSKYADRLASIVELSERVVRGSEGSEESRAAQQLARNFRICLETA